MSDSFTVDPDVGESDGFITVGSTEIEISFQAEGRDADERVSIRRRGNQLLIRRVAGRSILIRPTGAVNTTILELADE